MYIPVEFKQPDDMGYADKDQLRLFALQSKEYNINLYNIV